MRRPSPLLDPGSRRFLTGLAAGALIVAAAAPYLAPDAARALPVQTASGGQQRTITVSGAGSVTLVPDVAVVQLGVQIQRPKVSDARTAAAETMTRIVAAVRKDGVAVRDIQTTTISLQPQMDYTKSTPTLVGYGLSESVRVTVRDLDKVGAVLDDAMAAGATTVGGVSFQVDDPAAAQRQARSAAVADARSKADTLASAAGVSISGVVSISEATVTPVTYDYAGTAALPSAKTPVQAGTTDVTVSVTIVYALG